MGRKKRERAGDNDDRKCGEDGAGASNASSIDLRVIARARAPPSHTFNIFRSSALVSLNFMSFKCSLLKASEWEAEESAKIEDTRAVELQQARS